MASDLKSPGAIIPVIQLEDFRKTYISGEVEVHAERLDEGGLREG